MIPKTEKIWLDGKLVDWDEAKVHVLVNGLHYGSGIFEGIRCYKTERGRAIFRLEEHIDRFYNSAKVYFMEIPFKKEEIGQAIKEVVKANNLQECYIRPIAFKGLGSLTLDFRKNPVQVAVAVWPWGTYLGENVIERGVRCTFSSWVRIQNSMIPMMAKATGQYINSSLACIEAHLKGFDEALMLDSRGFVSEGPGENLFLVKNSSIITPSTVSSILVGITRDAIIKLALELGFKVIERDVIKDEVLMADELFFTGTAAEVTPIVEVDHRPIGEGKVGPITKAIHAKFFEVIRGADYKYEEWFSFID
ncbi:MAG: branched-chain amino acid transaminase [Nitrososphaeria archaeon]